MKKIFVIIITIFLAKVSFGQNEQKAATNSLIFKRFEQKNGFCRTGLSFNYFASTIGFSIDFFINSNFSVDFAYDDVYSFDAYYIGRSAGIKYWPKRIRSTNKLYPFIGIGLSEEKGSIRIIDNWDYLHLPVGFRYFFSSGVQITYHFNLRHAILREYYTLPIEKFTIGIGWRF